MKKYKIELRYEAFCKLVDVYEDRLNSGKLLKEDVAGMILAIPLADRIAADVVKYIGNDGAYGADSEQKIKENVLDAAKASKEFLSPDHKVKNTHIMSLVDTISEIYKTGEIAWQLFVEDAEACGYTECLNSDDMEDSAASVLIRVITKSMFDADYKKALEASDILKYIVK